MPKRIQFDVAEIRALAGNPEALEALADWHAVQQAMAEAHEFYGPAQRHAERREQLQVEAARIGAAYQEGEDPEFDD